MRIPLLAAALALSGCFLGCGNDSGPRSCRTNGDCVGSQVCRNAICRNTQGGAQLGEACASDPACSIELSCAPADRGFPGGQCTLACNAQGCPGGAVCTDVRASGAGVVCSKSCTGPADCRSGYTCCAGFGNACVPLAMCPATGLAASGDLGQPCGAGCAAGETCGTGPEFPNGGVCTLACNASNQSTCPANGKCVSTSTGAFCFATCGACPTGYACTGGVCRAAGAAPSCSPPGSPQIVAGGPVGPPTAPPSCIRSVQQSSLQALKLNTHTVGDVVRFTLPPATGSMSIVSQGVSAPDTITYKGVVLGNTVVPTLVKDPAGFLVYDDSASVPPDPSSLPAFYGSSSVSTGVMTNPNTSSLLQQTAVRGGLNPGQWSFVVNDFAYECTSTTNCTGGSRTSQYDVQVVLKPGVMLANGTVDVAFYIVGTATFTSATAAADAGVQRMLQTLGKIYANAGLCLGKVTFYDVPSWARARYGANLNADDTSPCGDLSQMFTLSPPGNQLNFFLVDSLVAKAHGGAQVVGVDGTIPGPSSYGGTVHSGAAVSMANLAGACVGGIDYGRCGADQVAYIAAHEGGHWMGLYHTTEFDGESFDPLTDTPTCSCESCAPQSQRASCASPGKTPPPSSPTTMSNAFCTAAGGTCGGGDNLMFWLLNPGVSTGALTVDQGQVIRANLVVR